MRYNPSFYHGSEINGSHWDIYIFRLLIMTCIWYIPQEDSMPSSYSCLPTDDIILFAAETIRKPCVPGQISIIFHHLYSVTVLCFSFDLKYYLLKTSEFIFLNVLFSLSSICFFCFFLSVSVYWVAKSVLNSWLHLQNSFQLFYFIEDIFIFYK